MNTRTYPSPIFHGGSAGALAQAMGAARSAKTTTGVLKRQGRTLHRGRPMACAPIPPLKKEGYFPHEKWGKET